jgi:uncharacterized membrane protein YkvA (DUF1232 family)
MGLFRTARFARRALATGQFLLKAKVYWRAIRDPRTPLWAKGVIAAALGYAVSPVDLIPDWVPLGGMLDDLVVTPALLALALKAIPSEVMADAEREENRIREHKRRGERGKRAVHAG